MGGPRKGRGGPRGVNPADAELDRVLVDAIDKGVLSEAQARRTRPDAAMFGGGAPLTTREGRPCASAR